MAIKSTIGNFDQVPIEPVLRYTRFISGYQKDCLPPDIEGECNSPRATIRVKSKLLHVRMLRSLQRVHLRTAKLRAEFRQQSSSRENKLLDRLREPLKFGLELGVELYCPAPSYSSRRHGCIPEVS